MQAYDVFMLAVLVAAVLWGAWKGLAWQIASIASIGLSYFMAVNFRGPVSKMFHYQPPEWNTFLAMLVLYLGTSLVVWVGFNLTRDFLEKVQLKEFDRQVGGLLGFAKGLLICTIITLFTVGLGTEQQRQAVVTARSGYYIARLLEKVEPLMPAEYRPKLEEAIARLEDRNGVPRGSYLQQQLSPFQNAVRNAFAESQTQFANGNGNATNGNNGGSGLSGLWNFFKTSTNNNAAGGQYGGSNSWGSQPAHPPQQGGFVDTFGGGRQPPPAQFNPPAMQQFRNEVLPQIEREQRYLQQEIDRYNQQPYGS